MAGSGAARPSRRGDGPLVVAFAGGATHAEAAERAGVSARTVTRRLAEPDFRSRVQAEREQLVSRAVGRLTDGSGEAAEALVSIASDADAPPTARVAAARSVLELGARLREQTNLADRITALEQTLNTQEKTR